MRDEEIEYIIYDSLYIYIYKDEEREYTDTHTQLIVNESHNTLHKHASGRGDKETEAASLV